MNPSGHRVFVCALGDVLDGAGVCALVDGEQLALFRVGEEVFALENHDPWSGANVLARGIVGDLQGQLVVASPVYKQHFNLRTGRCLEDESVGLRHWPCGVLDGRVWVERSLASVSRAGKGRRLVVVGNGMAAMRTVEELLATAPEPTTSPSSAPSRAATTTASCCRRCWLAKWIAHRSCCIRCSGTPIAASRCTSAIRSCPSTGASGA